MDDAKAKHPAKFSDSIVAEIKVLIRQYAPNHPPTILDPFAGVGKIFNMIPFAEWYGIEIEKEWAECDDRTIHGDCLEVMQDWWDDEVVEQFDMIVTSPAYGNRMADKMLPTKGAGMKYKYNTYTYYLGRLLHPNNGAGYFWHGKRSGLKYRTLHKRAWLLATRLLVPGGVMILNVSDYLRGGVVQEVSQWHVKVLTEMCGMELVERIPVATPRNGQGENGDVRMANEWLFVLRKPIN